MKDMNNSSGVGLSIWIHTHQLTFFLVILWSLFWAGLGLWHSAKRGQLLWFILFIFVHTLGVLEIIYLLGILKLKFSELFRR
ncbi:MAG: hypothetical protein JWN37_457 [Candidatus Nomurabacteria bacterium]|nr:hypothetical protein [Candidatus Nomurabacteria bacterium]